MYARKMRRTDRDIRHRMTGLMRSVGMLLQSAMMLTVVVVAVLAVVSCGGSGSSDDIVTPDPTPQPTPGEPNTDLPILFSALQQEEQTVTRSEGLELYSNSFTVYGYKNKFYDETDGYTTAQNVFPGYVVSHTANSANTTTTNTNGWEYVKDEQTIKYWDLDAKAYRFFGYTGFFGDTGELTLSDVTNGKALSMAVDATTAEGIAAAPYFSKLWFSTGNVGEPQFGQPVQLLFIKPFVRVRFTFISADPENVPVENMSLVDVSFKPMDSSKLPRKGTLTVTYPLTGLETQERYSVSAPSDLDVTEYIEALTEDYAPNDNSKNYVETDNGWYTLLPAVGQGTYILLVTVNGEYREVRVPAQYMDWLPGYEYTYVFKVFDEGGVTFGQVNMAFTDWLEGAEADYKIHNW